MKTPNLQELSNEQLAERFKLLSFQEAEDACSAKYWKMAYDERSTVAAELRQRRQRDFQADLRYVRSSRQSVAVAVADMLKVLPS